MAEDVSGDTEFSKRLRMLAADLFGNLCGRVSDQPSVLPMIHDFLKVLTAHMYVDSTSRSLRPPKPNVMNVYSFLLMFCISFSSLHCGLYAVYCVLCVLAAQCTSKWWLAQLPHGPYCGTDSLCTC